MKWLAPVYEPSAQAFQDLFDNRIPHILLGYWEKADDAHIIADTYGYGHEVVEGAERVEIPVKPGQLVFFNSRNFHEVRASNEMRLSLGGHMGLTPARDILMWV